MVISDAIRAALLALMMAALMPGAGPALAGDAADSGSFDAAHRYGPGESPNKEALGKALGGVLNSAFHSRGVAADLNSRLAKAVEEGDAGAAARLMAAGADANAASASGGPLLNEAIGRGDGAMAELLVRHGARLDRPAGPQGDTPLLAACRAGEWRLAMMMLRRRANALALDANGGTALELVVKGLVHKGRASRDGAADNERDDGRDGKALMVALMLAGADPLATDFQGVDAMEVAQEAGRADLVALMAAAGPMVALGLMP